MFSNNWQEMIHTELGALGEHYVARLLSGIGLNVEHNAPADLLVEGIPVEVKAARPRPYRSDGHKGYQFCIHREGRNGLQAELLILLCYWKAGRKPAAFVLPTHIVGERRKIVIPNYPWTYAGQWAPWYENWETIAEVLER
jgi:hypothetical protein